MIIYVNLSIIFDVPAQWTVLHLSLSWGEQTWDQNSFIKVEYLYQWFLVYIFQ